MKKHICTPYNPDCPKCVKSKYSTEWYEKTRPARRARHRSVKGRYIYARSYAKSRDHEWAITLEQFQELINKKCYYWPSHVMPECGGGLDRKDNNLGYTVENVVPCCQACNQGRNRNFTMEEWQVMVTAVESFRKLKEVD